MRREILTGLALTGASLLSACGEDDIEARDTESAIVKTEFAGNEIETTYLEDGTRTIVIPNQFSGLSDAVTIEWCSGNNLYSNTQQFYSDYNRGGAAGGTIVTPDFTPCDDGRLTPSDFEIQE